MRELRRNSYESEEPLELTFYVIERLSSFFGERKKNNAPGTCAFSVAIKKIKTGPSSEHAT
jgi:hypothetical protein